MLLLSSDGRGDAAPLFEKEDGGYAETLYEERLYGITAEFETLLEDFVRSVVPLSILQNRLLASSTFRYFTRATPGLSDLLLLGKIRELFKRTRGTKRAPKYDLVVLDAPATGHALSLMGVPRTLMRSVPAGPMRTLAKDLDQLVSDGSKTALVVVAEPAELAAREAEELVEGAKAQAGLTTGLVVVNRVGRSGATESLPRLSHPTIRLPELPDPDPKAFLDELTELLSEGGGRSRRPLERRETFRLPTTFDARPWLDTAKLLVFVGPGGVGKTTLSAAAGLAAARRGRRVLVMTVDPARRLAQALGISEGAADEPVDVKIPGLPPGAAFRVLQIDPKAVFERLLARVAPADVLARIQRNKLYTGLVDSLPGVLEYMGVEALFEHANDPQNDLIVLDTPPAARGLDFLAAPERMIHLLENDALRWFLHGDSLLSRALSGASRGAAAILKIADGVLGFSFLSDLADFFHAFDGLYDGFKARSKDISAKLREGEFAIVSSLDRSALLTAGSLALALKKRKVEPVALFNRVPEKLFREPNLPEALENLPRRSFLEGTTREDLLTRLAKELAGPVS